MTHGLSQVKLLDVIVQVVLVLFRVGIERILVEVVIIALVNNERKRLPVLRIERFVVPLESSRNGLEGVVDSRVFCATTLVDGLKMRLQRGGEVSQCFAGIQGHAYDVTPVTGLDGSEDD